MLQTSAPNAVAGVGSDTIITEITLAKVNMDFLINPFIDVFEAFLKL